MSNALIASTNTENIPNELQSPNFDDLEGEVQQVLSYLEGLRPEVQNLVYERMLLGLATQTRSIAKKAITSAKSYTKVNGKADKLQSVDSGRSRSSGSRETVIFHSQLSMLHDSSDPIEAVEAIGGLDQLAKVLPIEPLGVLEAMARHPRMPGGPVKSKSKTQKKLAEAIIQHLQEHLGR